MRFLAALALAAAMHSAAAEAPTGFFGSAVTDLKGALAEAQRTSRRGVAVMYYFDDCPGCRQMAKEVLDRKDVREWYRAQYVTVAVDILGSGRDYARSQGIRATPSFDFHGLDGMLLYRQVGGIYNGEEFVLLGQYVATGAHARQGFEEFRRSRKGL